MIKIKRLRQKCCPKLPAPPARSCTHSEWLPIPPTVTYILNRWPFLNQKIYEDIRISCSIKSKHSKIKFLYERLNSSLGWNKNLVPYWKKKVGIKFRWQNKSSIKNFVTGKIIRHLLPTNFFAWLSENINWIKETWIFCFGHSNLKSNRIRIFLSWKILNVFFCKRNVVKNIRR